LAAFLRVLRVAAHHGHPGRVASGYRYPRGTPPPARVDPPV